MASQTQGIQQLLAAEKRAAEKINEARKRKAQRLKQAKQEAQAEIEKYRVVSCPWFLESFKLCGEQRVSSIDRTPFHFLYPRLLEGAKKCGLFRDWVSKCHTSRW